MGQEAIPLHQESPAGPRDLGAGGDVYLYNLDMSMGLCRSGHFEHEGGLPSKRCADIPYANRRQDQGTIVETRTS